MILKIGLVLAWVTNQAVSLIARRSRRVIPQHGGRKLKKGVLKVNSGNLSIIAYVIASMQFKRATNKDACCYKRHENLKQEFKGVKRVHTSQPIHVQDTFFNGLKICLNANTGFSHHENNSFITKPT